MGLKEDIQAHIDDPEVPAEYRAYLKTHFAPDPAWTQEAEDVRAAAIAKEEDRKAAADLADKAAAANAALKE